MPILRFILNTSFLLQGYAYAFVVLYSIAFGPVDYVIPVKVAFATIVLWAVLLAVIDVNTAYNNRGVDLSELDLSIIRFAIEISAVIGGIAVGYYLVVNPFFEVSLTSLNLPLRAILVVAVLVSLVYPIRATLQLFRKRTAEPVLIGASDAGDPSEQ